MAYDTGKSTVMGGDDLYSDGGEDMAKPPMEKEKQSDEMQAVLPKSILAGKHFDVGDEVVLKITGMHDEEITVAYAPAKKEGGKEDEVGMEADMPEAKPESAGESDYD